MPRAQRYRAAGGVEVAGARTKATVSQPQRRTRFPPDYLRVLMRGFHFRLRRILAG